MQGWGNGAWLQTPGGPRVESELHVHSPLLTESVHISGSHTPTCSVTAEHI